MSLPPTNYAAPSRARKYILLLPALISLALYALLPRIAQGLTLAEPSFASDVFGWVKHLTQQSLTTLHDAGSHPRASIGFLAICGVLFLIYALMLKFVKGIQSFRVQAVIFASGAAFLLVQLFAPIMLSTDVYGYTIYGRVLTVYDASPYATAPPIAPGDPFMLLRGQEYLPSRYGPLWTLISAGVAWCGGENVGLTVLLFRAVAVLGALGCAAFIWASLRKMSPERATQGLVFFLWNPLLVIETGLSGHNDSVMLVLVLLGVWLHLRGWKTGAVIALTLSALVKFLTGMLVPLYVLLVLREMNGLSAGRRPALQPFWRQLGKFLRELCFTNLREKMLFLARSGVIAGAVCGAAILLARSSSDVPAQHDAIASDFYLNNFHEFIIKGIRRTLGEDAESIRTPTYFSGWWLAAKTNTLLHAQADAGAAVIEHLDAGAKLIVTAPQETDWARTYDPATHQFGFVNTADFTETTRPALADADPIVRKFEKMPYEWPTVLTANKMLRAVTWLLFAAFGLWCAWRTTDFHEFVVWAAAALLASYFLIITEIWPWYVNWALAVGALAPMRRPAKLALLLSAGVMTLNVTVGFMGGEPQWIAAYRSLFAFVLPLVLFLVLYCRRQKQKIRSGTPA